MKDRRFNIALLVISTPALLFLSACNSVHAQGDKNTAGDPPPAKVVPMLDLTLFTVDKPEQYPLSAAMEHAAASELIVTGTVAPDISRSIPVVSLASGRVMSIHARLGDTVQKGQLLLTIRSDDVSGGYSNYRKAIADEVLSKAQLERAKDLYEHGAIALNDLQIAQDTEDKAKVDLETMSEHLRLLGNDPDKPNGTVDIFAPVTGVITDQQVTNAAAVQAFNTPSPFTISDLSYVWIVCDVYENDLPLVRMGEFADIRLNAYPDRLFKGRIGNIGSILDPTIRTAKVRLEVENPGLMRIGMFVTATFHGETQTVHAAVPASSVLHLHDRDWVYVPAEDAHFRRVEVTAGNMLPGNLQEIVSGIKPGDQVVSNALVLQNTLEQ